VNKNTLYLLIGALVVVVIGLGVYVYREESKPSGVELNVRRPRPDESAGGVSFANRLPDLCRDASVRLPGGACPSVLWPRGATGRCRSAGR
jgi:hypothetical protein